MADTYADTYNGWKNYPTWAAFVWITNDSVWNREAVNIVRECYKATESASEVWSVEESRRFTSADNLQTAFADGVLDYWVQLVGPGPAADLLSFSIGLIDWQEIADAIASDLPNQ